MLTFNSFSSESAKCGLFLHMSRHRGYPFVCAFVDFRDSDVSRCRDAGLTDSDISTFRDFEISRFLDSEVSAFRFCGFRFLDFEISRLLNFNHPFWVGKMWRRSLHRPAQRQISRWLRQCKFLNVMGFYLISFFSSV